MPSKKQTSDARKLLAGESDVVSRERPKIKADSAVKRMILRDVFPGLYQQLLIQEAREIAQAEEQARLEVRHSFRPEKPELPQRDRGRPLDREVAKRNAAIRNVLATGKQGLALYRAFDAAGVPVPDSWKRKGSPHTFEAIWKLRDREQRNQWMHAFRRLCGAARPQKA